MPAAPKTGRAALNAHAAKPNGQRRQQRHKNEMEGFQ